MCLALSIARGNFAASSCTGCDECTRRLQPHPPAAAAAQSASPAAWVVATSPLLCPGLYLGRKHAMRPLHVIGAFALSREPRLHCFFITDGSRVMADSVNYSDAAPSAWRRTSAWTASCAEETPRCPPWSERRGRSPPQQAIQSSSPAQPQPRRLRTQPGAGRRTLRHVL